MATEKHPIVGRVIDLLQKSGGGAYGLAPDSVQKLKNWISELEQDRRRVVEDLIALAHLLKEKHGSDQAASALLEIAHAAIPQDTGSKLDVSARRAAQALARKQSQPPAFGLQKGLKSP